ncbi:RNA polymerase sigma factor [Echinicola shivajiensis]|uniref:RNA polymerase sigma factor n=1 Tax=Echinicola shivajiensis TaxID=1035916 RepID=UPI001BFC7323|nr:sigma-70 family RNA polymerase sigma factor [Echinicola shivajiensis]
MFSYDIQIKSVNADSVNEWWEDLRNGDKSGLKAIYSFYVEDMYRYGMAILNNKSFVKDCVQEVFISLWKYRKNLREETNVKQYLFKSLSNKIQKEVAKESKLYHSNEIDKFEFNLVTESFERQIIDEQQRSSIQKKLSKSLSSLPSRQREVIHLLFFEELTYEEVSKLMGINIRSVYTLAWKAISSLKKSLIVFIVAILYSIL